MTTTSGLFYKIPGRVGDSPILGAGLYLDNEVGSAGSTGRGEANLLNLSSFAIVDHLRRGLDPKDALIEVCKRIVATNRSSLACAMARGGRTSTSSFYCVTKDGRYAGASLYAGDEDGRPRRQHGPARRLHAPLYPRPVRRRVEVGRRER